jgi:Leucine-rich repeat (LRR) protein
MGQVTGTIPDAIGQLSGLTALYLGGNGLTGTIPSSIGRMTAMTKLDLNTNKLTGAIPSALAKLTVMDTLDLVSNNLSGALPPLPFAQYTGGKHGDGSCLLDSPECKVPYCNHFSCPLPANISRCIGHGGPGVHCE